MTREILRRAIFDAQLSEEDLATKLAVDPRTVRRWLSGQVPRARRRAEVARLLGVDVETLWPASSALESLDDQPAELVAVYPRRVAITQGGWQSFFASAQSDIGVLAYSALFLAEDARIVRLLSEKVGEGVRVRIALGDPDGHHVGRRGIEEEIGPAMSMKVRNAIVLLKPLLQLDGIEFRLHDTALYNSMYRSDGQMLVNQHAFGSPAAQSPVYHYREGVGSVIFQNYLASFERIWALSRPTVVEAGGE
ncbi:helix-turn-helix domain-containing protein [Kribbella sp. CA-293567]|uniref:helix-turn-helix domain-containing protein n=1 Tax=Kribbella sp. CA-293567 TaxID=3002436 RepID=UPI0022DD9DB6|nr:XRE family transcriptional regulator [Kribbella sp. CA-293567]WBQ04347.1 XRE family transcriptional regulator [Kribbella sp. CA-293567]